MHLIPVGNTCHPLTFLQVRAVLACHDGLLERLHAGGGAVGLVCFCRAAAVSAARWTVLLRFTV